MFLKSIDLFGFKSFAEKSHIQFTDGISALIGPNGCGKSNVVDAVKWVLGEQATKSLRAERMEDVIFNGTDTRKPLNVAEVTLTLENNGVLPLDVPEITVKRRLFRSGESEYFINNTPVKLKDVRELFYDTGIGKSAYSIMEQGKIDQILSTKPEDRRSLFEEAAGITRYKMRGREADRKLERTEANMHEVESVLAEVRRSYESLKKQADKTIRYRTLRDQAFDLELDLQLARVQQFREQQRGYDERYEKLNGERERIRQEIDGLNETLESELDRVNSMETRLVEVQKRLYGLEVEKSSRLERVSLIRGQLEELQEQITAERSRLETFTRRGEELEDSRRRAEEAATETDGEIVEIERAIAGVEERINRSRERQGEARERIEGNEATISGNDRDVGSCQRELRGVTDELVTALDTKLRESGYSTAERRRAEEALKTAADNHGIILKGRRQSLIDRAKLQEDSTARAEAMTHAFDTIESSWTELEAAITRYQGTIPRFLDDFLAPEGTITRKRTLDDRIETLQRQNVELREKNRTLQEEITALDRTIETERGNLEEMRLNRVHLTARAQTQRETAERHRREIGDNERQIQEVEGRIARNDEREREMHRSIETLQGEFSALEAQEGELRREVAALEEEIARDNSNLKSEEQNLKTKMQELARVQEQLEEVQVRRTEKRTEIRGLFDGFNERHGRDLREFEGREPTYNGDQKRLREEIGTVRNEIKELGSVNLMAVEEFAEVSDRYEFLKSQIDDLRAAREDLVRVTAEIKRESEQLFVETYNRIRKNFHTVFRRLFGGGRAELRLVDPDSVLESGIDILVQPPGKKLESIALLSGGERSLTAVALLFATFMVRPSPFTLLDEIDAALDEHNVTRFVTMLHEFAQQSQFIVITHNKKTVAGANTLLGVTMQESGMSQIVAVRIDGKTPDRSGEDQGADDQPDADRVEELAHRAGVAGSGGIDLGFEE
ncbi:MAG: chromosome segregation SMC family protein [Alkalispirochaeta sp.]